MKGIHYYYINNHNSSIEIKSCNSYMHSSKAHSHNEISIALIEKGHSNLSIGDNKYFIETKSILIIPSNIIHLCKPSNLKEWKFKMIFLNKSSVFSPFIDLMNKFHYKKLNSQDFFKIKELFNKLTLEIDLNNHIEEILKFISPLLTKNLSINNLIIKDKIKLLKDYIDKNSSKEILLKELSIISNLNKYHIIRQFKKHYGLSPHKYINMRRVFCAKELMKTNNNIAEVAIESGFYDQSHLSKNFIKYMGITPSKYIKEIKQII